MKIFSLVYICFFILIAIATIGGISLNQIQQQMVFEIREENIQQEQIDIFYTDSYFVVLAMVVFMGSTITIIITLLKPQISKNIEILKMATTKIAKGDLQTRISLTGSKDEIFDLATDINKMAEELEKNQSKILKTERFSTIGEISARLAHDIRNPLAIIQTTLENLKSLYETDDESRERFNKVERSIDRINHLMKNVLDFVREQPVELNQTKFSWIIKESLDSINIPNNIKLILPKNDIIIIADKKQFAIVLNNLIMNAIQAIEGAGTIEVITEKTTDTTIIQIKDSGSGISKENIEKIFDPLFTLKMQGTGLGLSSVQSIINSQCGTISVTSPPTIFTITLPNIFD